MASLDLSIYLVTDSDLIAQAGHQLPELINEAVKNGVTTIQLREKESSPREFLDTAMTVAQALPDHVTLIINDRVDVFLAARLLGARVAGVHVGQNDLPAESVRNIIGEDAILGLSASTDEQLRAAEASNARVDYFGIGAIHATTTKVDAPPPVGYHGFRCLVHNLNTPAVAIGGISVNDVQALKEAGASGVAVVSAICSAQEPGLATRQLRTAWDRVDTPQRGLHGKYRTAMKGSI